MTDPLWLRIVLLVLDKLVLAGILTGAVLLGQRWLEGHKARQALVQGLVALRINAIAKLCDQLAEIELALYDTDVRFYDILAEQAPIAAAKGEFKTESNPLFAEAVDRIATAELVPRLSQTGVALARFAAQVAQPTFWVPESVTELFKEYIESLNSLHDLQQKRLVRKHYVPPVEMDATTQLVRRSRLTLDTILKSLSKPNLRVG